MIGCYGLLLVDKNVIFVTDLEIYFRVVIKKLRLYKNIYIKNLNISSSRTKKKHANIRNFIYIYIYIYFANKMEKQKENVEIRVLKWERAWNNDIGFFF